MTTLFVQHYMCYDGADDDNDDDDNGDTDHNDDYDNGDGDADEHVNGGPTNSHCVTYITHRFSYQYSHGYVTIITR